ncbi:MAG: hypothetical protein GX496_08805 [Firmicutes bacterium]|uniref:Uncharacterized protein n=1 Tax=Geochorda subterranea TaxID=3109564 RepID=A0ABZ1BNP2_9FIRM|nr:hypothetical protein [Limnochorda sp. LNt]NLG69641.1 hypothetical protein [Bacillota bacterium]WRP14455.1 hypothetical protein VLY81_13695 [Limnochorda sp. LNt]
MDWHETPLRKDRGWSGPPDRHAVIQRVMTYVREHPQSFASLAVCRRALGSEPDEGQVDDETRARLEARLETIPDEELEAYYYIVS